MSNHRLCVLYVELTCAFSHRFLSFRWFVGLLTYPFMCGEFFSHKRIVSAFSLSHDSSSNDRFSSHARFALHGNNPLEIQLLFKSYLSLALAEKADSFRVRDSHPIPLFSWNKNACPFGTAGAVCTASASVRVAHLPQKPVIDSFFIFVFAFPRETTKKTAVSQAVRIHHIHLVFIHGCFHVFDKYQPKSAAERASCRCNRKILLSAYLFALMYASAPEKFLHPSDNSSPVSSF